MKKGNGRGFDTNEANFCGHFLKIQPLPSSYPTNRNNVNPQPLLNDKSLKLRDENE